MDGNQLCGIADDGDGEYTTGGITKLCEGLKGSSVTSLRCALGRVCSPFCQCPLTRACSLTAPTHTDCSLMGNGIGDEGAYALAAILKETKITHL